MNKNKSFTLIELLVVIVIIGILAGVIMISTSSSIDKANLAKAQAFSNTVQEELLLNLISEWTFDEPEISGKTKDSWSTNSGTVTGADYKTKDTRLCISGGCYYFNGSTDHIDCGNKMDFNGKNNISFSAWINLDSLGAQRNILGRHSSWTDAQGTLRITSSNVLQILLKTTTGQNDIVSIKTIKANQWYYIAYSWDGSFMDIYINGKLDSSTPCTGLINTTPYIPTNSLGSYVGTGSFFVSLIDDARIYDAALTSSQIKQNYIAGLNSMLANGLISRDEYSKKIDMLALK